MHPKNQTTNRKIEPPDLTTRVSIEIPEVAASLGVSARTVEKLIAEGHLESFKIGSRRLIRVVALRSHVAQKAGQGVAS